MEIMVDKSPLNFRLVKKPRLPTPDGDLLERSEAQVSDFDPTASDPPHCVFGSDVLLIQYLREINMRLRPMERRTNLNEFLNGFRHLRGELGQAEPFRRVTPVVGPHLNFTTQPPPGGVTSANSPGVFAIDTPATA